MAAEVKFAHSVHAVGRTDRRPAPVTCLVHVISPRGYAAWRRPGGTSSPAAATLWSLLASISFPALLLARAAAGCIIVVSSGTELGLVPRMPPGPGRADRVIAHDREPPMFRFQVLVLRELQQ